MFKFVAMIIKKLSEQFYMVYEILAEKMGGIGHVVLKLSKVASSEQTLSPLRETKSIACDTTPESWGFHFITLSKRRVSDMRLTI